jgi:repressor of nif and glnA expression
MNKKINIRQVWTEKEKDELDETLFLAWHDPEALEDKVVHTVIDISTKELREIFKHAITIARSGISLGEKEIIEDEIFDLLGIDFVDLSEGH